MRFFNPVPRLPRITELRLYVNFLVIFEKVWILVVYKIPYRRAPRLAYRLHRPLGRVRCASKGILHTRVLVIHSDPWTLMNDEDDISCLI